MGRSDQFFHGTTHAITDGVVRPVNDVPGKHVSEYSMGDPGDMSEGDHAFAIRNDENYAWHAAGTFHKNGRRPRVYEVEPAADMKPGPWNKEHPDFLRHAELDPDDKDYPIDDWMRSDAVKSHHQDEWASKTGFPVKKRIDIMPGRQGTFPEVNWNRFKGPDTHPAYGPDVNHPSDDQIKYGTHVMLDSSGDTTVHSAARNMNETQFGGHDWHKDPAPHSELREMAGRPQKRWATLLD